MTTVTIYLKCQNKMFHKLENMEAMKAVEEAARKKEEITQKRMKRLK